MTLLLTVILVALVFEYINGFHDTANSIATVVSTKVLTPRQAVLLAACTNLLGAMWGTAVAQDHLLGAGGCQTGLAHLGHHDLRACWARSSGTCSPGGSACPPVRAMR